MEITLLSAASDEFLSGLPDDTALAFGLTWAPMTAGLQSANAVSMAVAAKTTHLVHVDGKSSVGLARLNRGDQKHLAKDKITRVLSAASLFAALKPVGTSLVTLPIGSAGESAIEDGGDTDASADLVWLGAVSNGTVLRGHDAVVSQAQADQIWSALQERYSDKASRFDAADGFGWQDLVDIASERQPESVASQSLLKPARAGSLAVFKRIPKPVKYAGVLLGVAALAQYVVIPLVHFQIAKYHKAREAKVNPVALWQDAYNEWAVGHKFAGAKAAQTVMGALGAMPVHIARWNLDTSACERDAANGTWKCQAVYQWPFDGIGPKASTNAAFQVDAPKDWTLEWSPLGSVTARFQVQAETGKFDPEVLQTESWHLINSVSYLQRFDRVLTLTSKPIGKFARVSIAAPRLANGAAVPAPSGMKFPLVAPLQVDGPLRSMTEKVAYMPDVSWKKVSIFVVKSVSPDRNKSELKANFQGEIYAKP